jgi:signal transduction histidine kinase
MRHLNSIRARLTMTFMLIIGLVVVIACSVLVVYSFVAADRTVERLIETARRDAEQGISDLQVPATPRQWLREHSIEIDAADMAAVLVGTNGQILQKTQPTIPSWPRTADGWRVAVVEARGEVLVIGYPWYKTLDGLRSQAILLSLLGLFMILVTGAASWALVGQTLSPIRLLSRQAQAASTDNLRLHLEISTRDVEVTELVTTLNGLLARIADSAAERGRFYAAASHELRTPLQALSGHLELALNRDRDAAEYRTLLEEARVQTKRLTTLAQDLLFLNRLETGSVPAREPVEVSEICERVLTHLQPLAARRQLSPHISLVEEAVVPAPPLHVEMLIRNLVENAVKYASPGGYVSVSLMEGAGGFCLEVFNSFEPEPRLDSDAIFEPFFRPDASRNTETGGNGLGLAICKALTTANRWPFEWRHDDDGVHATVWFPELT